MTDPAVFVSPIRVVLMSIKLHRKARARVTTHLNTSFRRRPKFNGDFQLLVLIVTSLALLPTVWCFCEMRGVAQEIGSGLLFEIVDLEDLRSSGLYVKWECDDCRKGRLAFASKVADWFRCGALLLACLACAHYRFSLRARAVETRLKLHSQIGLPRNAAKHTVFKTRSLLTNRLRWRGWRTDSRWLS